jgi:hypothetical protein
MCPIDTALNFVLKLSLRNAFVFTTDVVHFAYNFLFDPIVVVDSLYPFKTRLPSLKLLLNNYFKFLSCITATLL